MPPQRGEVPLHYPVAVCRLSPPVPGNLEGIPFVESHLSSHVSLFPPIPPGNRGVGIQREVEANMREIYALAPEFAEMVSEGATGNLGSYAPEAEGRLIILTDDGGDLSEIHSTIPEGSPPGLYEPNRAVGDPPSFPAVQKIMVAIFHRSHAGTPPRKL